jgi:protein-S-isoprenylcysteine O-methyltransferase Ste14
MRNKLRACQACLSGLLSRSASYWILYLLFDLWAAIDRARSYWGLLAFVAIALVILWQLFDEERFLKQHLPGYIEYCHKVRYRLVPFVL